MRPVPKFEPKNWFGLSPPTKKKTFKLLFHQDVVGIFWDMEKPVFLIQRITSVGNLVLEEHDLVIGHLFSCRLSYFKFLANWCQVLLAKLDSFYKFIKLKTRKRY